MAQILCKPKKYTREENAWNVAGNLVLGFMSLCALFPFALLIAASFTDNTYAMQRGFSLFPGKLSLEAYRYISNEWAVLGRAYLMTILVTVLGTAISILLTSTFAYALGNRNLPGQRALMALLVVTMLFRGGIVSSYYIYANVFKIRNTLWALIVPNMLLSPFNVILVRNYYINSVSPAIMEAARIDGASEYRTYAVIVMPLSLPILATIGMMTAIGYWNEWTNGMYYLTERGGAHLFTIQLILNKINENINFLANNSNSDMAVKTAELPSTTMRMAIAVIGIVPIMCAYPFFQKYFVKGITLGGVKE